MTISKKEEKKKKEFLTTKIIVIKSKNFQSLKLENLLTNITLRKILGAKDITII